MQNLPREHEVSLNVNSLVTHMGIRGLKINPTKIQQSSNLVKCLEIQWRRVFRDINSKVENKSLHLGTPTTKKEAQQLVCISELWRHHTPSLDLLRSQFLKQPRKLQAFCWGLKTEGGSVKGPGCCAGCSASFMVRKEFVWSLWQCLIVNHRF